MTEAVNSSYGASNGGRLQRTIPDLGGKNSDVRISCWVSKQRMVGHRPQTRPLAISLATGASCPEASAAVGELRWMAL
jgi:hypothetical protein